MNQIAILAIPCACMVLDIATGYAAAAYNGNVDSSTMARGLWKKLSEIGAIVIAKMGELALAAYGGDAFSVSADVPLCTSVCAYLTIVELVSCMENVGKLNPTVAAFLRDTFGISADKLNLDDTDGE